MTPAEFNQRVAVGAQVAIRCLTRTMFARTESRPFVFMGAPAIFVDDSIGRSRVVVFVADVRPLWFGEECDD
mgnify:CR=1 FL=1